jgi:hypothetical protein
MPVRVRFAAEPQRARQAAPIVGEEHRLITGRRPLAGIPAEAHVRPQHGEVPAALGGDRGQLEIVRALEIPHRWPCG